MRTHWRPIPDAPKVSPYARCMCGKVFEIGPDADTFCSTACARADALKTLMAGHSYYRQKGHNVALGIEDYILPDEEPFSSPHAVAGSVWRAADNTTQQEHIIGSGATDNFAIGVIVEATTARAATPRHPELPGRSGTPMRKGPPPPLQLSGPPSVPSSMVFDVSPPPPPTTKDMPRSALFSELDADQAFVFISSDVETTGMAQDVWSAVQYLATAESPDARAHLQAQDSPGHGHS